VAKFDPDGNHQWSKGVGGALKQEFVDMALDSAGNLVLVGANSGDITIDGTSFLGYGSDDVFVMKLRADGSPLWSRIVGGPYGDRAESVVIDDEDNLIFVDGASSAIDYGGGLIPSYCNHIVKLGP